MTTKRAEVVAEAMTWLGTPWRHQGRLKGVGVDCLGLIIGIGRACAMVPPSFDITGYGTGADGTMLPQCEQYMVRKRLVDRQLGDVLVLHWGAEPHHMGIIVGHPQAEFGFLHALGSPQTKGRVLLHHLDAGTLRRTVACYGLPGVEA